MLYGRDPWQQGWSTVQRDFERESPLEATKSQLLPGAFRNKQWSALDKSPIITYNTGMKKMYVSNPNTSIISPSCFTRREAAEVAGVSLSTLDRETKAGRIPFKRIRGRVLYPKAPFLAWCESPTGVTASDLFDESQHLSAGPSVAWKFMGIAA
jgi:excisionase family DNA binding protein